MAVAALAGLVRGFSGFGGAMIYMPLIATIYDPRIAAVTILLVDLVSATPFAIPEVRRCTWREVTPLAAAMASGWRYRGTPRLPITLGVGLFSGISAGAVLIAGPPVILYWLSGGSSARI